MERTAYDIRRRQHWDRIISSKMRPWSSSLDPHISDWDASGCRIADIWERTSSFGDLSSAADAKKGGMLLDQNGVYIMTTRIIL
jgi:hypothetical protein